MKALGRRSVVLVFSLVLVGGVTLWTTSTVAARQALPAPGTISCPPPHPLFPNCSPTICKTVTIDGLGTFNTGATSSSPVVAEAGDAYISSAGLKTVPLKLASLSGTAFAEGIGETKFWLDASRSVESAVWEKSPNTEFPAIQEMRFNFFYTVEAMPGKVYRSVRPAVMRADNLNAFPPPPGTVYRLVRSVELEDVDNPGTSVGRIESNQVVIPQPDK